MVEPDKKGFYYYIIYHEIIEYDNLFFLSYLDYHNTTDLEDTVRNLREENAKLLQLLRSRKKIKILLFINLKTILSLLFRL